MNYQILIADDSAQQRELLRFTLERNGYGVVEADTGKAAVRLLTELNVDLVLLDLGMPDGRGDLVIQWIIANRPNLRTRVIVLSGDPESVGRSVVLNRAEIAFIPKPYERSQLLAAVEAKLPKTN